MTVWLPGLSLQTAVCLPTAWLGAPASRPVCCRSRLGFLAVCGRAPCPHAPFALKVTLKPPVPSLTTSLPRMFQPAPLSAALLCHEFTYRCVQVYRCAHLPHSLAINSGACACLVTVRGRPERPHRWGPQRHLGKAESNSSQQPREFQGTRLAPGTPFSPQARFLFKFRDMVKTFRKCAHRYVLERKSCWVSFEEYRSCYIDVVSYPDTDLMNCSLMVTIKLKAV